METTIITTNSTVSSIIIIFDGIDLLGAVIINKKYITWVRDIYIHKYNNTY